MAGAPPESEQKPPLLNHPLWLVVGSRLALSPRLDQSEMRVQADILHRGPHNRQATGLGREHVDLIGALPHIDFPGFQWRWSSECAGAWPEGTQKT